MSKHIEEFNAPDRAKLTGPALRGFWNLASRWSLTDQEQMALLGITSMSTLRRWQKGEVHCLRRATLERLSLLFGIYAAINAIMSTPKRADRWMRLPNKAPLFGGRSAMEHMLGGLVQHLRGTRDYLDAILR